MTATLAEHFRARMRGTGAALTALETQLDRLAAMAMQIGAQLRGGGVLYTCGNGGSSAQALHLAEELVGRYRADRPPQAAVCLNADPTALTCIANDYGFEQVFARPVQALCGPGDVLLVLSTSGDSANLVHALDAARERGATTVGLLGHHGGECAGRCDHLLVIPGEDSAHTQEAHLVALHLLCEALDAV